MTVFAEYVGEEIFVTFSAETDDADYGVPGSPVFDELDQHSIQVIHLTICGIIVKMSDLPVDLRKKIMWLADGLEWKE